MRKQLSNVAIVLFALLLGLSSCKENGPGTSPNDAATGGLAIDFRLLEANTKAIPTSTAKPHTSWADITRAIVLFVDPATSLVKDTRIATLSTTGTANSTNTYLGVVAGINYDVYVVGNYPTTWNLATIKGSNVNTLEISAPSESSYAASPHFDAATFGYGEIGDVFVAKQSNITVTADVTNTVPAPFMLTRINSLFRVRLDVNSNKAITKNDKIDFTAPTAMVSVRRAATYYQLTGATAYTTAAGAAMSGVGTYLWAHGTATAKALNVFFKQGALSNSNPTTATHSNPTTILASGSGYDVTLWNEYRIFPGTNPATLGRDKLDLVISAVTTDGNYTPAGYSAPVPMGTRVFWSGQIQQTMGPNQILELSVAINNAGTTTLPPVGEYGGLTISANIVPWGDIVSDTQEW